MAIEGGGLIPLMVAIIGMTTMGQPPSDNPQPKPCQRNWFKIATTEDHVPDEILAKAFYELLSGLIPYRVEEKNCYERAIELKATADIGTLQVPMDGTCANAIIEGGIQKIDSVATSESANGGALSYHFMMAVSRLHKSLRDLYDSTKEEVHDWQVFMRNTISAVGYTDFLGVAPDNPSIITKMETVPPTDPVGRSAWIADLRKLVKKMSDNGAKCVESWIPAGSQVAVNTRDLKTVLDWYDGGVTRARKREPISMISLSMPLYIKNSVFTLPDDEEDDDGQYTSLRAVVTNVLLDYIDDMELKFGSFEPYDRLNYAIGIFNGLLVRMPVQHNKTFIEGFQDATGKIMARAALMLLQTHNDLDVACDVYISVV